MSECQENSQKLIEKIQKYKDENLTVYFWLVRAFVDKENLIWGRNIQNLMSMDSIKFIEGLIEFMKGLIARKINF